MLVDCAKWTIRRWVETASESLAESTGDDYWHDRGGWEDLETFLDDYLGTHSPEAQKRERGKVDWL